MNLFLLSISIIKNLWIFKFLFFRSKYTNFVRTYCDQVFSMVCAICKEKMTTDRMAISNPCGHFFCTSCCSNQVKIWHQQKRKTKPCPVCRITLENNLFSKPFSYISSNSDSTTLSVWTPTNVTFVCDLQASFIRNLWEKDHKRAFRYAFLCGIHTVQDEHLMIDPQWGSYFYKRKTELKCSECQNDLDIDKAFVGRCGHFFCTYCSGFLLIKPRTSNLKCSECHLDIQTDTIEHTFLRPL